MTQPGVITGSIEDDREDVELVKNIRTGSREALEVLVARHQPWIYNLTLRMLYLPQDAEDATQEILIKVITSLAAFEGRSRFRTWLYRIVTNHTLNMKRGRVESVIQGFGEYGHGLDATPDLELPDPNSIPADVQLLVEEARIGCTSGMLLCLDREQRHSVEVLAESLYEAAALGLKLLRDADWVVTLGPMTRLQLQVRAPTVMHEVTIQQLQRWLDARPSVGMKPSGRPG